ncbi:WXG100 family type VII secretion target [Clostridium acetobutylicum]|uniref:ESAT-6-like protein n=1 Tax=Clostridium acetobutylicum (strain ATCC 824 / DSM 792 / JCM 1419 / IAM 19013 / LMG 5710 / NBRC 13948 / NRRL B-527 / VKM B-1787 / 2291 / W) TaxID=272562 RepID=Q97KJ1_CLOAB|nr:MULTISPECIES: WXG100 family type VII secretion target [Clostridium]AAK78904.1 Uncharacterized small conserved protein, homolog of yfjA/yukE B.subtilis [Clostridium acetobutylicum ATCC 824]ADZ19979.1 Conserved hypothetical protein [Clostridium acetobutylicum EA 2018]AEI31509.1 hypothetical protein SMB_G0945 [Clostridium acetobutylicum DSM 1731]AWV80623.1 WXG100 family type VII secretion target [Clostridium acetobutylicum]MBC2392813.1 WXG100 family type VII secretion target [Clostridium aceto
MVDRCDIEIDASIFEETIKVYSDSKVRLHDILCDLENELRKMEDTWEGDAKKEFDSTFPGFYSAMKKDCDMLEELIKELKLVKTSFESLDTEMKNLDKK